jgi:hypothetical protein
MVSLRYFVVILISSMFLFAKVANAAIPAFPGAEGFGSNTPGGRGGQVYEVTNLSDSGSGSFRACAEASGPRICVFRTGGTITVNSRVEISNPYITIAGQTAPGDGITIRAGSGVDPLRITTHDVVIRYIRSRSGRTGTVANKRALTITSGAYNVVIDHVSLSWATDETLILWYDIHDITIQWSIISEALVSDDGCGKGPLLGSGGSRNYSFHHNLVAHNCQRSPNINTSGVVDAVNNVIYNGRNLNYITRVISDYTDSIPVNVVGNYFKPGPSTQGNSHFVAVAGNAELFLKGNRAPNRPDDLKDEAYGVLRSGDEGNLISNRHPAPKITETSADEAYNAVLAIAGSSLPGRDAVDIRVVNDVINGTGRVNINDPSEVGGWPVLNPGTPPTDSDHDGMPNDWENQYSFNPNSSSDGNQDYDGDGYTNIEEYLNGTNPRSGEPIPTNTPTPGTGVPGDANGDDVVDVQDYFYWINNYNTQTSGGPQNGDFNKSGFVDGLDYLIWLNNYSPSM